MLRAAGRRGLSLARRRAAAHPGPVGVQHGGTAAQRVTVSATAPRALSAGISVHRDEVHNREETPFEFTDENYAKIAEIRRRYPKNYAAAAVIPLLDLAQRQAGGWLPLAAMNKVARILGMPNVRVYEVASFYTMFNREKIGRYNVQVCTTTPCMIRGGYEVLEAIKAKLGIDVGGDTSDGVFHLMEAECLGACVNAPMVQINDDFYEDLTPATVGAVLDGIKAGTPRKIGPQNGRNGCEGPMGRTTLAADFVPKPYCRDLTPPPAADGPAKK